LEGSVANAETALLAGLSDGESYLNIHSSVSPGGEIRGFLAPVPEPSSVVLLAALVGLLAIIRLRVKAIH
jgi:hypothetical protein